MKKSAFTVLFLSLLLSGCGWTFWSEDNDASSILRLSNLAPPEAPYEEVPPITNPASQVWRPGHWDFDGKDFSWIHGEMMTRPSPTAVWSPDRWEHRGYGWAFIPGIWQ